MPCLPEPISGARISGAAEKAKECRNGSLDHPYHTSPQVLSLGLLSGKDLVISTWSSTDEQGVSVPALGASSFPVQSSWSHSEPDYESESCQ